MSSFSLSESHEDVTTAVNLPVSGKILCCLCGVSITPNAVAMCLSCMQQQPEFLSFPSESTHEITQCPKCDRWSVGQQHDQTWVAHELESSSLLSACLKKVSIFHHQHDVKILDASWIWTEPHSRRLKFYVDTERLLFQQKLPIQQRIICNFIVKISQCKDCIVKNSEHTWGAQLQIRQSRGKQATQTNEQLLITHKLGSLMIDAQVTKDGLDLFFDNKQKLEKVTQVLTRNLPCLIRSTAKKLVSRDTHTSVTRTEHVVVLEVVPLLKNDIVLLSKPYITNRVLGIVRRVTSTVHIMILSKSHYHHTQFQQQQPQSGLILITAEKYFRQSSIPVLMSANTQHYTRYLVLDVTPTRTPYSASNPGLNAEIELLKEDDANEQVTCDTDLGHLLSAGDIVLGYDLSTLTIDIDGITTIGSTHGSSSLIASSNRKSNSDSFPDVIIVAKVKDRDRSHNDTHIREDNQSQPSSSNLSQNKKQKHVSGGGGKKKRNRIPPWRRDKVKSVEELDDEESEQRTIMTNDLENHHFEDGMVEEMDDGYDMEEDIEGDVEALDINDQREIAEEDDEQMTENVDRN
jgi:nonsense-mediated mRNA decay protein 3